MQSRLLFARRERANTSALRLMAFPPSSGVVTITSFALRYSRPTGPTCPSFSGDRGRGSPIAKNRSPEATEVTGLLKRNAATRRSKSNFARHNR